MNKTLIAVTFAAILVTGAAYAGTLSDPVVAPEVVVADAVESSSNVEGLIAAVALIAIILGAAGAF
ncbi:hypothetical protein [Roseovarius salis]|uniref:hypothetical protein n=1 Tax=Roseovarius salis TaxID=3376063 RepID=UPI0037C6CCA3